MPRVPPFDRPATYEDLERLPPEVVAEIVNQELHASPRPAARHAASAIGAASLRRAGEKSLPARARTAFLAIIAGLRSRGAKAVVLGCTEIPLLIRPDDCPLPLYDTLAIHAAAGVEFTIGEWSSVGAGEPDSGRLRQLGI